MAQRSLRLKALACEVLARQVYLAAARSPHAVDTELLEQGLHDSADTLRAELQRRIDATPGSRYDAIVLVYGLCNRATEGLGARDVPLVLPRAHDCITLYLGSRERYNAQFETHPGTYYYSAQYMERSHAGPAASGASQGVDQGMAYGSRLPSKFEELVRQYGEDNARYLLEVYGNWHQHYNRAAYISLPCTQCDLATDCSHAAPYRRQAQDAAAKHGWEFVELPGDPSLVRRLLGGAWWDSGSVRVPATATAPATAGAGAGHDAVGGNGRVAAAIAPAAIGGEEENGDILVVPPGLAILATFDDRVVAVGPARA